MTNLILLVVVTLAGYLVAGWIHKKPIAFKVSEKFSSPHISGDRINEILLQENHGYDIDTVVENVRENNASLPFNLLDSEIKSNEN